MGLLIGASALTLCEVIDLLCYNSLRKCIQHRKKARPNGTVTTVKPAEEDPGALEKDEEAQLGAQLPMYGRNKDNYNNYGFHQ